MAHTPYNQNPSRYGLLITLAFHVQLPDKKNQEPNELTQFLERFNAIENLELLKLAIISFSQAQKKLQELRLSSLMRPSFQILMRNFHHLSDDGKYYALLMYSLTGYGLHVFDTTTGTQNRFITKYQGRNKNTDLSLTQFS